MGAKAPFEHEKFSAAFQIKFDRGNLEPNACLNVPVLLGVKRLIAR